MASTLVERVRAGGVPLGQAASEKVGARPEEASQVPVGSMPAVVEKWEQVARRKSRVILVRQIVPSHSCFTEVLSSASPLYRKPQQAVRWNVIWTPFMKAGIP